MWLRDTGVGSVDDAAAIVWEAHPAMPEPEDILFYQAESTLCSALTGK